jgi:hypothetical protein
MAGDSYPVQDFLEALTSQLDRTQDALRLKAVNRPLTYAIRDFSLSLHVFVEMDEDGQVRFRSSGANESGASTVDIGLTTINRANIDENTPKLAEVASPSLGDLGLAPQEQRQLERLGVRNAAQLRRLNNSSGESAVARFADVPVSRLRAALQASSPTVRRIEPDQVDGSADPQRPAAVPEIRIPAGTRRLRLDGRNLSDLATTGTAQLDGVGLPIIDSGPDHAVIDLGQREPAGRLELQLDGGPSIAFQLAADAATAQVSQVRPDLAADGGHGPIAADGGEGPWRTS